MKLKSLLLGSAAVLVGVVGSQGIAQAADAIVVEPEPVEYVRICDAYGAGWFYIPGTETCLKFDGDVRVQYGFTEFHDEVQDETSTHEFNYRVRLNVRANNETEYGTLSSRIRFKAENTGGSQDCNDSNNTTPGDLEFGHCDLVSRSEGPYSAPAVVDWAVISLAGFRIGFADSYWTTAGSFGYYQARFDGPYSYRNGLFFDYTWAGNGWTATLGLEDGGATFSGLWTGSGEAGAPDVYAGVTYTGGGWYFAGVYYHDSSVDAGAWKVRADYDFGSNGIKVGGWYMSDDGDTDYVKGHAWGVTAKMNIADNMVLFGGYGQFSDQFWNGYCPIQQAATGFPTSCSNSSFDTYTVGVTWNIVPGLLIQPEYTATWYENELPITSISAVTDLPRRSNLGRFSLRVARSF